MQVGSPATESGKGGSGKGGSGKGGSGKGGSGGGGSGGRRQAVRGSRLARRRVRIPRVPIRRYLLACCCAALTACAAGAPKGPDTTVTAPAVGRPPAPASAQAALSSEAFTPYAGLGATANDGLAPGDTYAALHTACMNDAGYGQYADSAPYPVRMNAGLTIALPFGPWGYIGTALAALYGFNADLPGGLTPGPDPSSASAFAGLPASAQAAAGKCVNILMDFNNAQFATSMAGIESMNDAIGYDVFSDPNLKNAIKAWSACMARNGYTTPDAKTLAIQELRELPLGPSPTSASGLTAAQIKAQIAMAVADADCTQATDLAGIFFAIQASYEQQLVDANQQALNAAVREYKANYARELNKLPALLRTTSATISPTAPRRRSGNRK
jgi:hypothetical protein